MRNLLLCLVFATALSAQEQAPPPAPCQGVEARQFDFWLGDWTVRWGEDASGTNRVTSELGDCVIVENFNGLPGTPLIGMSVSTYNRQIAQWQQTWVDNQGGYLDFTGGWQGDRMILQRQATREGVDFLQRMVWYDIQEDQLQWHWERSDDDGATWQVLWHLQYERQSAP